MKKFTRQENRDKEGKAVSKVVIFLGLLTLLFIALKLAKAVSWSWAAVFAPLWFPAMLAGVILLLAILAISR